MLNIGLIGYGSIGSTLANAIRDGKAGEARLVAVLDIHEQPPYDQMDGAPRYFTTLEEFLDVPLDVVVEAATQSVLRKFAPLILKSGRDVVAMSVGAFVDEAWLGEMEALARAHGCRIYLPPGAIGGLDALSAAMLDNVHAVSLTTIKPVKALRGSRSVVDPQLDLERITEATCLYDGPAEEAVRHFPKNVNVAAALSLSTIGFRETRVRIIADPHAKTNTHRIHAEGRFGSFSLELNLNASPANPKTSYLAALSAIRLLKGLTDTIRIGV